MTTHKYFENGTQQVIQLGLVPMLLALAAVPLTYNLVGDQQLWPYLLGADSLHAQAALTLTHSAGAIGAVIIVLAGLIVFITRQRLSSSYRAGESLIIAAVAIVFTVGGTYVNKHYITEALEVPRPHVQWMASSESNSLLTGTVEEFYARGDVTARSEVLQQALAGNEASVPAAIQKHWIQESGYGFPSGHAYVAFFVATFLIFIGATFIEPRRKFLLYLLAPWAAAVAYSRVALMVHSPFDVSVGALDGVVTGIIAWLIARSLIRVLANSSAAR